MSQQESLPDKALPLPSQVPLEEQLGNLRKEFRLLCRRVEMLENHAHLPSGQVVVSLNTAWRINS